eukprot:1137663-Pelagomonas_calceolata.AAC.3
MEIHSGCKDGQRDVSMKRQNSKVPLRYKVDTGAQEKHSVLVSFVFFLQMQPVTSAEGTCTGFHFQLCEL